MYMVNTLVDMSVKSVKINGEVMSFLAFCVIVHADEKDIL